jgi:uncharacterized protein (DUF58 family)
MSLRRNALWLVLLTVAIAIIGDWNAQLTFHGWWALPAALLLLGLAYESRYVSRCGLRFEVDAPARLYLGRSVSLGFLFAHRLQRRSLAFEFALTAPEFVDIETDVAAVVIESQNICRIQRHAAAGRLGEFAWPPLPGRIAGPLGLAWWSKVLHCEQKIKVVPDLLRSMAEIKSMAAIGEAPADLSGGGAEVLRLREYRAGDPPRLVDWKATARAGRLISRDFSQDRGLQIVLMVDAGRSSQLRAGTLDRFGHYVNVAARLAQFAADREDLVGLVVYADRPLAALAPARGAAAVSRLRAILAATRIERTESNPLYAVTRVKSLVRHRSLIIVLTDFDDASTHSQLAQAVRFLLPKHLPFVAGLSSAAAEAMSNAPPQNWLDPYRALAAQEYCIGLQRKVRALNAMGAPALAARPEQLEGAVFAAYERFSRQRRA